MEDELTEQFIEAKLMIEDIIKYFMYGWIIGACIGTITTIAIAIS